MSKPEGGKGEQKEDRREKVEMGRMADALQARTWCVGGLCRGMPPSLCVRSRLCSGKPSICTNMYVHVLVVVWICKACP